MPRQIETFSRCAAPDVARGHRDIGGLTGFILDAWYTSKGLTIVGGLAFLIGIILAAGPVGCIAVGAMVLTSLSEIKHWYYNERLLCIEDRQCAIGTVISEPTAAFDGDRKLNLMLAPYSQREIQRELIRHLDRNREMLTDDDNFSAPFHPDGAPALPTQMEMLANPGVLRNYLAELEGSDPDDGDTASDMYNQTMIGLVDTLLSDPEKDFFERFYRVDDSVISDPDVRNAIPEDFDPTVNWQNPGAKSDETLNPMFRFDNSHTVPYLHTEVEGNYLEVLINRLITGVSAFIAACSIPVVGPILGAVLGFLAWLFHSIIDWISGNDGDAARPDVEWDDPNFTGYDDVTERTGDVVVVYGHWIMDTEHHEYFEIHPVRAYYIIAESALDADGTPVLVSTQEEQVPVGPNFDPTRVDEELATQICDIIEEAEERDPDSTRPVSRREALSHGMKTQY